LLQAFVHVRSFATVNKPTNWKWENRGKLEEAESGIECLILQAFNCRNKEIQLVDKPQPARPPTPPPPRHVSASIITCGTSLNPFIADTHVLASTLLSDSAWRNKVTEAWRLDAEEINHSTHATVLAMANDLQKMLLERLPKHVNDKVPPEKRCHWCLYLTASKLGHVAAIMVLLKQVVEDLNCDLQGKCLLANSTHFRKVSSRGSEDGIYLYWNTQNSTWIRVGMVAGRTFNERGVEHKNGSMLNTIDSNNSKFYRSYPSCCSKDKVKTREGFFENLRHCVALGYPLSGPVARLVEIFQLSGHDNQNIEQLNFAVRNGGTPSLAQKQKRAMYYLLEMAYGLCLSEKDNVSKNPGWEQGLQFCGN
jgi:hypothetical protein